VFIQHVDGGFVVVGGVIPQEAVEFLRDFEGFKYVDDNSRLGSSSMVSI
jgi:hypothetical protein